MIKSNQNDWLKPYIVMNTELRQKAKNNFEKDFFKLMNNSVFRKTIENVKKYRDIKLIAIERRRSLLVLQPNYHRTKFFTENKLAIEMKITQVLMNKPVYLVLSIFDLNKTEMYEFWHDYVKPKYGKNAKHCFLDMNTDVEKKLDTLNFEIDRSLRKRKIKK